MCILQDPDTLHVILPYFNYCGFDSRRTLFIQFIDRLQRVSGITLTVVEVGEDLPRLKVKNHIRLKQKNFVWIKENLINIGISSLPDNWRNVAWIDADISFVNSNWVKETKAELRRNDIVQMFQSAINLGPDGETIKVDKGFAYMYKTVPYVTSDKYGHWHPGYAWAMTHRAWNKMGKLIEWAILGSADRHMAMAWIGKAHDSYPGGIHPSYKALIEKYQEDCKGVKISYVSGTILHHWHGSLENRRYKQRWTILVDNKFDPLRDVGIDDFGMLCLTNSGRRLELELIKYFQGRKEDS